MPQFVWDKNINKAVLRNGKNNVKVEQLVQPEPQVEQVQPEPLRDLDSLKREADELGIKYHHNIGFERLSDMIADHKERQDF